MRMASDGSTLSVWIVEDDPVLRTELRDLVDEADGLQVVAAHPAAEPALACSAPLDLAIVDLGLPDLPGAELIRQLSRSHTHADFLAHTVMDDRQAVFDAIVAGASGYLLKGATDTEIIEAIRELRSGGSPMSPRIAREVVRAFRRQGTVADRYTLSAREHQVLELLEEGLTYKEVAARLTVSRHTVHTHIKRIYDKLHANSRAEALTKARLRGML